ERGLLAQVSAQPGQSMGRAGDCRRRSRIGARSDAASSLFVAWDHLSWNGPARSGNRAVQTGGGSISGKRRSPAMAGQVCAEAGRHEDGGPLSGTSNRIASGVLGKLQRAGHVLLHVWTLSQRRGAISQSNHFSAGQLPRIRQSWRDLLLARPIWRGSTDASAGYTDFFQTPGFFQFLDYMLFFSGG